MTMFYYPGFNDNPLIATVMLLGLVIIVSAALYTGRS